MFSKVRKRLTYTNIALTLALVFAMSGGAYAAKKYVITSTKQISPTVLKTLQGKVGPAGAAGPQGSAGPTGTGGSKGENGAEGKAGSNGKDGASVTSKALLEKNGSGHCEEGGSEFTAESKKTYACNGSPWTAGGTLPSGKTETGVWSLSGRTETAGEPELASISFAIPLTKELEASHVIYIPPGEPIPTGCKGTEAQPEAEPGDLCVFSGAGATGAVDMSKGKVLNVNAAPGASTTGAIVFAPAKEAGSIFVAGTWAVTAE